MLTNSQENWYQLKAKSIAEILESDLKKGLSNRQVVENRKKYGKNVLEKEMSENIFFKFLRHLKSPMNFILIVAGFTTVFLGMFLDAIIVFVAVAINLIVGIFQEDKADKAFEKLNVAQHKKATVLREGKQKVIDIEELVLGDVIIVNAGMYIGADIRLFDSNELSANESALTGEWLGVEKSEALFDSHSPMSEKKNMLWLGTSVSSGYGQGLVVALAKDSELGKISENLNSYDSVTPMKNKINRLVRFLTLIVLLCIVSIFILGVLKNESYTDMFLMAVAIAIAVIPEGLPVATTAVLAVGMKEILKKGGLVKNLLASETLGNVSVILTDKTGTITEAKMRLSEILSISESKKDLEQVMEMAVLGSDAFVEMNRKGELIVQGRPLEKAIVNAGLEKGVSQDELKNENARLDLLLFSSKNGYSASLNKTNNKKNRVYVNGRPEIIIEKSKYIFEDGHKREITTKEKNHFLKLLKEKTNQGLRLTAQAYRDVTWDKFLNDKLENLVFVALLAFEDPVRKGVRESLETTKAMGIRTVMLTGDNEGTARKIAEEVGIIEAGEEVLRGEDIDKLNDMELESKLKMVNVFARMKPQHKLRVSKLFKVMGEVIAMTGDGINDAPALRNADVGMAVESGTEVAKESADLILLDNSFSVIVFAIEEGRRIIDNLKKIVAYLLSTSFAEVFVVGGSLLFGFPLPILASQILWINIIEEGLMNFAFVFEPKEQYKRDVKISHNDAEIITPKLRNMILTIGLITGIFLIAFNYFLILMKVPIDELRTLMFIALSVDSLFFAISLKSLHKPLWKINIFSNKYLLMAWALSFSFILGAIYLPFMQMILHTVPLNLFDLGIVVVLAIFNLFLIEGAKYFFFEKDELIKKIV